MRNCCSYYSVDLIQIFFSNCLKLIWYFASAVNVVWSDSCVAPSPRIKTSFSLLSICTDDYQ